MSSCSYYDVWGYPLTWLHAFPWLVSLALWVGSLRPDGKKELVVFAFSWYLWLWSMALWALQINFMIVRPHELCGHILPYAFPSVEAYLFGALVGAFCTYAYFKHIRLSWISYLFLYTFTIVPQTFLVVIGYNRWWEVLITFVIGIFSSFLFVSVFMLYIRPMLPYLETQAPCTWFHLVDSYCTTHEDRAECKRVLQNVEECQERIKCMRADSQR